MLIGISSNIKKHYANYCDFIDYYWIKYFNKKNYKFITIPNSSLSSSEILNKYKKSLDLLVLQGGNDIYTTKKEILNRNKVEQSIINFGIRYGIPILGVCRGMQLINLKFNGKIKKKEGHMLTKHGVTFLDARIFNTKKLMVNSFHNYCVTKSSLAKNMEIIAEANDKTIELFKHKKYKIYGVMWHPERTKSKKFLDKLIKFCK